MNFLRNLLHKQKKLFEKGGKFEQFYYLFEAGESFLFTPAATTGVRGAHIRDAIDLKRTMITVVFAMIPCLLFGIVSYTAGGIVEAIFAIIRKHPINEGFLVTGMLIPLVVPVTIPLWQVAFATIFSVLIVKEVFGGTGMNILNVAMTARAFLYFAYPTEISGEIWTYQGDADWVDGYSGATALAVAATSSAAKEGIVVQEAFAQFGGTWNPDMFSFESLALGTVPGSIGETSFVFALIGGLILVATGVGSWKIIVSVFAGAYAGGLLFNALAVNTYMAMPAHYHLVMGGLAFGAVFMATDPVSAAHTEKGKWVYGFLIGLLTVIIRVFNPAYPEGIMLAVLLMNVFAPLIDFYIIEANKKMRLVKI